jgi:hypothetical protein
MLPVQTAVFKSRVVFKQFLKKIYGASQLNIPRVCVFLQYYVCGKLGVHNSGIEWWKLQFNFLRRVEWIGYSAKCKQSPITSIWSDAKRPPKFRSLITFCFSQSIVFPSFVACVSRSGRRGRRWQPDAWSFHAHRKGRSQRPLKIVQTFRLCLAICWLIEACPQLQGLNADKYYKLLRREERMSEMKQRRINVCYLHVAIEQVDILWFHLLYWGKNKFLS